MNKELWGDISWPVGQKKVNNELKVEYPYDIMPSLKLEDQLVRSYVKGIDDILTQWINKHGYSVRDISFGHVSITGMTHPDHQSMYVMEARGRKLSARVLRFSDLRKEEKDHSALLMEIYQRYLRDRNLVRNSRKYAESLLELSANAVGALDKKEETND